MHGIGLMSGTSGDGVDVALVDVNNKKGTDGIGMDLIAFDTFSYGQDLKDQLRTILPPEEGTVERLTYLHYHLGEVFAEAVNTFLEDIEFAGEKVKFLASHGHTVRNLPPDEKFFPGRCRLQIGEIAVIAERTGITTVGDFRPAEVAAGGEGAPIIPFFDYHMFHSSSKERLLLNIGGIANFTYLKAAGKLDDLMAFDVGPGNMLLDQLVYRVTEGKKAYDEGGEIASRGQIDKDFLASLMEHSFVQKNPPKSAGHEDFGKNYADEVMEQAGNYQLAGEDLIATATEFTAEAIKYNASKYIDKLDEIIISGGGANNEYLISRIAEKFPQTELAATADYGVPIEAKEAMGFALLGFQTLHQKPNNVPSATGAAHPVVMGKIAWGPNDYSG